MKKTSTKIRLLFLLFLAICTLLDSNILSWNPIYCIGGYSTTCEYEVDRICYFTCESRDSTCKEFYCWYMGCNEACQTLWDYECEDGYMSTWECWDFRLLCPMK